MSGKNWETAANELTNESQVNAYLLNPQNAEMIKNNKEKFGIKFSNTLNEKLTKTDWLSSLKNLYKNLNEWYKTLDAKINDRTIEKKIKID